MTAQVKRFPTKTPAQSRTPEEQALWVKCDGIADRLERIAHKAALLSLAVTGLMELDQNDDAEGLRDAADEINGSLGTLAEEVRS
jgi:hypothetical protein